MATTNTPILNLTLAVPGTNEAFSTSVVNGNFSAIDTEVGTQRSKDTTQDTRLDSAEGRLDTLDADSLSVVASRNYARIRRAASGTIPSSGNPSGSANTEIDYDTEDFAEGVTVDLADNSLTIEKDGLYAVRISAAISANATGYRYLAFKVNGTAINGTMLGKSLNNNGASHSTDLSGFDVIPLVDGDILTVEVGQASGADRSLNSGSYLEIVRIGPKFFDRA